VFVSPARAIWALPTSPRKGLSARLSREAQIELPNSARLASPETPPASPRLDPIPQGSNRPRVISHHPRKTSPSSLSPPSFRPLATGLRCRLLVATSVAADLPIFAYRPWPSTTHRAVAGSSRLATGSGERSSARARAGSSRLVQPQPRLAPPQARLPVPVIPSMVSIARGSATAITGSASTATGSASAATGSASETGVLCVNN
jgi:hypothetical protein